MNVQVIDENNIIVDGVALVSEDIPRKWAASCNGCYLLDAGSVDKICGSLCCGVYRQDGEHVIFVVKSQQEAHDAVVEEGFHSGLYNFDDLSSVVKFWYSCDNPSNYEQLSS